MHHNTRNMKRQGQNSKDGDISDTKVAFLASLQHNTPAPRHHDTTTLTVNGGHLWRGLKLPSQIHAVTTPWLTILRPRPPLPFHHTGEMRSVLQCFQRASFALFVISWFYLLSTNARPCSLITRYQSFSWCVCSTYYQLASPLIC